ncbi:ABC transporter permease [Lactiplantibacillus dongliensis]|uniref:ABC transporter permease n=1 Tax=Lactiplantibacillus dongliensis TaxID=2559919 RepID=A0ABW1RBG7_9LACO|nr:ABC transporter permease [Lactiplantibacillus dongliensis]
MSTKRWAVTRYILMEQLQLLWRAYAIILIAFVVLPLLFAILTGNLGHYSFTSTLTDLGIGVAFGFFISITMSLTYDNFKLLIQNGISRKTYWQARVISLIGLSFGMEIIATLYNFLVTAPARGHSGQAFLGSTLYSLYDHFLGSNLFVNILGYMVFNWLFFIGLGLTGMAVGSIFSLLTKFTRNIALIAIPVLGFFLLVFLSNSSLNQHSYNLDGLVNFLKFLMGYHANAQPGYFNPTVPMLTMIIGCVIMGGIAYYFNQKLKLKK